jgi:phosphoribosylanthranilate isomerase
MEPVRIPRVKICCISSLEEARLAIRYGVSAVGLVSDMPSGPGVIEEELIAEIAAAVPPPIATFLLTCRQDSTSIIEQLRRTGCSTVQICDRLTTGHYGDIRAALPGVRIVPVVHVAGPESVEEAIAAAVDADGLLLDSGMPTLAVKELGGTGRVHDWGVSRRIREVVDVPVFLAGGLKPENVAQAIADVGPFGLDACTGVRTDGKLDEAKLAPFMRAAGYREAVSNGAAPDGAV